jgi:hypothetical protein
MTDPDPLAAAAIALGEELRLLAHAAGDFVRVTDEALLLADPENAAQAEARLTALEDVALHLAWRAFRFCTARTAAHRLRDGE